MSLSNIKPSQWDDTKTWDLEWALDWDQMTSVFEKITELKKLLENVDMPFLYRQSQQIVILNLEKFAFSLSKIIGKKYS